MKANHHSNSALDEMKNLMDLTRAAGEDKCIIKHSSELFFDIKSRQSLSKESWFRSYKTFFKLLVKVVMLTICLYINPKRYETVQHFLAFGYYFDQNLWGLCWQTLNWELAVTTHPPPTPYPLAVGTSQ